jgi:rhodanese-related sulfurtransferase
LIPYDEIDSRAETEFPNKDMHILIYCRSGRRSAIAAQELIELGYTNVYDFGGIIDWPYTTVSG